MDEDVEGPYAHPARRAADIDELVDDSQTHAHSMACMFSGLFGFGRKTCSTLRPLPPAIGSATTDLPAYELVWRKVPLLDQALAQGIEHIWCVCLASHGM